MGGGSPDPNPGGGVRGLTGGSPGPHSEGYPGPHPGGVSRPRPRGPKKMATVAGGTHPTGMHSC